MRRRLDLCVYPIVAPDGHFALSGRPLDGRRTRTAPDGPGLGQDNAGPACHARETFYIERHFYIETLL